MKNWRASRKIRDPLYALYGLPYSPANSAVWQPFEVLQTGYVSNTQRTELCSTSIYLSIEGVEKNNDHAKHNFYSSNRHGPCGEVLLVVVNGIFSAAHGLQCFLTSSCSLK